MAVFQRHNFTKLGDRFIQLTLLPKEIYNTIPTIQIRFRRRVVDIKDVYFYFTHYGFVITVFELTMPRDSVFDIYFNNVEQARSASRLGHPVKNAGTLRGLQPKKPVLRNTAFAPVFWTPPLVPQKTKGSLIGVPTNITVPAKSAKPVVQITHVVKGLMFNKGCKARPQSNVFKRDPDQLLSMNIASSQERLLLGTLIKGFCPGHDQSAWGSQLDISTFRLHYVEMRQYGDKESAAEVLAIRNTGRLPVSSDALAEGVNITARGPIMAMKCLESGHLVTASKSQHGDSDLFVWDMRDSSETAKVAAAKLHADQKGRLWFDARGMEVCSVDRNGTIKLYDLTKTVASSQGATSNLDYMSKTDIDLRCKFYSSCISINDFDSTVLVGSSEHAQIARWDFRSPSAPSTTTSCRDKSQIMYGRNVFDPIYGVEWNPSNSNEFMTVHKRTLRVWDARKMGQDSFATFHNLRNTHIRKAAWSPHRTDVIAGLTSEGQVRIWRINKFDGPADPTTLEQEPEPLRVISDFAWCPYLEDVISTVSPGTVNEPGNIQVWRPRNLHSSDDHGEP
ncbi:hypothetical protein EC968_003910 [Mortierella alpina]|nr:hypothetical protein EC968_003910 [Mortierella alpina]